MSLGRALSPVGGLGWRGVCRDHNIVDVIVVVQTAAAAEAAPRLYGAGAAVVAVR